MKERGIVGQRFVGAWSAALTAVGAVAHARADAPSGVSVADGPLAMLSASGFIGVPGTLGFGGFPFAAGAVETTTTHWIVAASVATLVALIPIVVRSLLVGRLRSGGGVAHAPRQVVAALLGKLNFVLFLGIGIWAASLTLDLGERLALGLRIVGVISIAVQCILLSVPIVDAFLSYLASKASGGDQQTNETLVSSMGVLRFLGIGLVTALAVLVALDNLHIQVTPLLTGLGIGGIAVALAAQNILGDLFASASILLDKPFVVGDFIIVGNKMGTVERIGVKTTRVKALSGEQLIFSNSQLLSAEIQNFKRMQERRAAFTIGVTYDTAIEHLRAIPQIVQSAIESREGLRFDRCTFKTLNAYSLDFETVFFVGSPDMLIYLKHQEAINLRLIEEFRARGIDFAFPTQVEIVHEMTPKRA
jgi:small-conductance mechanosensitive channel